MNDAFPIADREGVLVVVTYSYEFFDPDSRTYEMGRFIVVYRYTDYDHFTLFE